MGRSLLALALTSLLTVPCARAQTSPGKADPGRLKKEPFLGLHLGAVPELLYAHLPRLPQGVGVVVELVRSGSPADRAGLKRHDILLSCNGKELTEPDQFARYLRRARKGPVPLVLYRAGKEMTVKVNLTRALRAADEEEARSPRATVRKGPMPAVTVRATLADNGKMQVRFEYAPGGKGKPVVYTGSLEEVEAQVQSLPADVQDLAKVALDRLRTPKKR